MSPTPPSTAPRRHPETRRFPTDAVAEAAYAAVTVATIVGFVRLFAGDEWVLPLLAQAAAAHLLLAALRRLHVPTAGAVLVGGIVGLGALSGIHAGEFTTYGIPTGDTMAHLTEQVRTAFGSFDEIKAPVAAADAEGFLISIGAAVWISALIGDWAAFRMRAPIESLLPTATLFGVTAVLGTTAHRTATTTAWIAAVFAFVLAHRADRVATTETWVGDTWQRGPRSLLVLGVGLGAVATALAALLSPALPGAHADAIVSLTELGDDDPGTRVTVSPLVDIRSRLVDQADVEVFTVHSDVRAYWRLTSLDRFDGEIWSSNGSFGKTSGGALDDGVPVASEQLTATQRFEIAALSQIWLPAAYEPRSVDVEDAVRYDEVSGTLIVDTEIPTSDGATYGVVSALPIHQPSELATASNLVPGPIIEKYLSLPSDFSGAIGDQARQLAAGATSAYEAALRLQDFFRSSFTYDLDIGPGHSDDAMEFFVFESRTGYCEQFAGSFAAMARSLGIPARVAVGFTPGVTDPDDPTLYRVRGEHAHAWPEVYLGEYGWVPFEPTPGRGAPFAEQYTGVAEQQVASDADPTTATTAPSPPSTQSAQPTSIPTSVPTPSIVGPEGGGSGAEETAPNPWPGRVADAVVVASLLAIAYVALALGLDAFRRARRAGAARTAADAVALAWDDASRTLTRLDVAPLPSETSGQAATRVATAVPGAGTALRELAGVVEAAAFAPTAPTDEEAARAGALADRITAEARAVVPATVWWGPVFHPRTLRPGGGDYSSSRRNRSRISAPEEPR